MWRGNGCRSIVRKQCFAQLPPCGVSTAACSKGCNQLRDCCRDRTDTTRNTTGWTAQWSLTVGCGVMQLLEASKRPEDFSIMLTDMLFRTPGRTNLLRVPSTYHLKPDAAETLRARILRATACFHTVRDLFVSCASVPAMLGPVHVRRAGLWGTLLADTFPSDNARSIGVICPHACPSKKAS